MEWPSEFRDMPETGAKARATGSVFYFTGRRCTRGHLSKRYSSSSNCVACIEEKRGVRFVTRNVPPEAAEAYSRGELTYRPSHPCHLGHWERRSGSGNCVECTRAAASRRKDKVRAQRIERDYGMSLMEVQAMKSQQGGVCAICQTTPKHWHIDHNHSSGKVRGMLCGPCNQGLGLFKEDTAALLRAREYINAHSA